MEENKQPSTRRSIPSTGINDAMVDKEVTDLFGHGPTGSKTPGTADDFIARTSRSKVAIVIPLYGYWSDHKITNPDTGEERDGFLDETVLDAVLEPAKSYIHNSYIVLLAEKQRLPTSTAKVINRKFLAGNVNGIDMPNGSSYGDYLRKGMEVALKETDAQYIVFMNPWVIIQDHGVDTLIDRVNLPDNAPVICGYDMFDKFKGADQSEFLKYKATVPMELRMLTFNFFGVTRYIADMCPFDAQLKTQAYLERDFFQNVSQKGYNAVCSERVPIYSLAFDAHEYTHQDEYDADKAYFLSKWKFIPDDLHYE